MERQPVKSAPPQRGMFGGGARPPMGPGEKPKDDATTAPPPPPKTDAPKIAKDNEMKLDESDLVGGGG